MGDSVRGNDVALTWGEDSSPRGSGAGLNVRYGLLLKSH